MSDEEKFQELLRSLLQFEFSHLDFGIYRLLNIKRAHIEDFLTDRLPRQIMHEFPEHDERNRAALEQELKDRAASVREIVHADAILANGMINPGFQDHPLCVEYETLRKVLANTISREAQRTGIFNHLYSFFSRYYIEGDFGPRRFYGAQEKYALPYNGEEVILHWANKDQHYVKTSEVFRNYSFSVNTRNVECRIRFVSTLAGKSRDNTKGELRLFFPLSKQSFLDKENKIFTIPFEYRTLTGEELRRYGTGTKAQEAILNACFNDIINALPDENLREKLIAKDNPDRKESPSVLMKRLRHFSRRITKDFFIHRDLQNFLMGELDFYIKDQMLHSTDLGERCAEKLRMLEVFRTQALTIIDFLSQIEDAQKRLFEMKKFALRVDYILPVMHVPREMWSEVMRNTAQREEWKNLYSLNDIPGVDATILEYIVFLEKRPTLPVNTEHFAEDFMNRLLSCFDDLDAVTDGVLIQSENYQALRFLQAKYGGRINCIYIDPPYNTGSDGFLYKDSFLHSSWMTMMAERIRLGKSMLSDEGFFAASIGEEEYAHLKIMLDGIFPGLHVNTIITRRQDKNLSLQFLGKGLSSLSVGYEYIALYAKKSDAKINPVYADTSEVRASRGYWKGFWNDADRPTMRYELLGVTPQRGQWKWKREKAEEAVRNYEEYRDRVEPEMTLEEYWEATGRNKKFIRRNMNGSGKNEGVEHWVPPAGEKLRTTNWTDLLALKSAANDLGIEFPSPKNPELIENIIQMTESANNDIILDYFAGSGATAHAVMNLNRKDGRSRRFILVEMGEYFDTVLLPRIKKILYSPVWKNGYPAREATDIEAKRSPRLIKILRLESYEDSLQNIATDAATARSSARSEAYEAVPGEENYRLRYMIKPPLDASDTLLNMEKLERPFQYKIDVMSESGIKRKRVDIPESFCTLAGLHVLQREIWENPVDQRAYLAIRSCDAERKKRILVIFRDMDGLNPELERDFLVERLRDENPYDEMFINGDTAAPAFRSLDGILRRMIDEGER